MTKNEALAELAASRSALAALSEERDRLFSTLESVKFATANILQLTDSALFGAAQEKK
jgi:hypothetical protein